MVSAIPCAIRISCPNPDPLIRICHTVQFQHRAKSTPKSPPKEKSVRDGHRIGPHCREVRTFVRTRRIPTTTKGRGEVQRLKPAEIRMPAPVGPVGKYFSYFQVTVVLLSVHRLSFFVRRPSSCHDVLTYSSSSAEGCVCRRVCVSTTLLKHTLCCLHEGS